MKHRRITGIIGALSLLSLLSGPVFADSGERTFSANLEGFQEVPSISSLCEGKFLAKISNDETSIEFELSYENLEGVVQQAHIHFGQRSVNGGVSVFLCSNLPDPPPGTQSCPGPFSGSVSGVITAASVIGGAAAQGIAAGELEELIEAIRAGKAYANVHSDLFPGGECRGQVK
jgi:hypothetical protein